MTAESSLELVDVFLLHRRPYGNSSLLLECFGAAQGRFPLVAKGVLGRKRSPQAGLLQPFSPLRLAWRGRGQVKTLTRVEPAGPPVRLAGKALFCALYVNELLMRLLQRNDPHEALFLRYGATLDALFQGGGMENTLRRFELALLTELGYGVDLSVEVETGAVVTPDEHYHYCPGAGLFARPRSDCVPLAGETIRQLVDGGELGPQALAETKRLTRRLLALCLDGRPLKSRELFETL